MSAPSKQRKRQTGVTFDAIVSIRKATDDAGGTVYFVGLKDGSEVLLERPAGGPNRSNITMVSKRKASRFVSKAGVQTKIYSRASQ